MASTAGAEAQAWIDAGGDGSPYTDRGFRRGGRITTSRTWRRTASLHRRRSRRRRRARIQPGEHVLIGKKTCPNFPRTLDPERAARRAGAYPACRPASQSGHRRRPLCHTPRTRTQQSGPIWDRFRIRRRDAGLHRTAGLGQRQRAGRRERGPDAEAGGCAVDRLRSSGSTSSLPPLSDSERSPAEMSAQGEAPSWRHAPGGRMDEAARAGGERRKDFG